MKKLPVTKVKIGQILAEDVVSSGNIMIAPKGAVVTESIKELFSRNSIFTVTVEDEIQQEIEKDTSYFSTIKNSEEFKACKENYEKAIGNFKTALNDIVSKNSKVDTDAMVKEALSIYGSDIKSFGVMDFIMNMRDYDDSTFCHSMNVALICKVFSEWLHWSEEDREKAVLCGLLHDIGKLKIPDEIVKKPGKLTEEEFNIIKTHPVLGYRILDEMGMDAHVKNAALMHHEKCDGSGYPIGLRGNQLDRFAKLVTIADIYDAMTAARVYRGAMSPFAVVDAFEKDGLQKYDPEMIMVFLTNVANSFLNNTVTLSNGHEGKVIFINKMNLSRPTILCGDEFVDLANNPNIDIEKMG